MAKPIKIHSMETQPNGAKLITVNSSSDARKRYTIKLRRKVWSCSCQGWIYRFPRKDCRHIREIKSQIAA